MLRGAHNLMADKKDYNQCEETKQNKDYNQCEKWHKDIL